MNRILSILILSTVVFAQGSGGHPGGGGGSGYATVQSPPSTALTPRTVLAFRDGLTGADNSGSTRTEVDKTIEPTAFFVEDDFFAGRGTNAAGFLFNAGCNFGVCSTATIQNTSANHPGVWKFAASDATAGNAKFRVRSTAAGTFLFSVDGGTETSITTNLPSTNLYPLITDCNVTGAATAAAVYVDYFGMRMRGLSR